MSSLLCKQPSLRSVRVRGLAENIQKLPSSQGVLRVRLPKSDITIENVPGKKASVAIYAYLASKYGESADPQDTPVYLLSREVC